MRSSSFVAAVALLCAAAGAAQAGPKFNAEIGDVRQHAVVKQGVAIAVDDSTAEVGRTAICDAKVQRAVQGVQVGQGVGIAVDGSSATVGGAAIGGGC